MAPCKGRGQPPSPWCKFEFARTVFKDPFAVERLDYREDYGEEMFVIIGMAEGEVLLFAAYTERQNVFV